jgi:hypothetical protein
MKQQHKRVELKPGYIVEDMLFAPPMPDASLAGDRLYAICEMTRITGSSSRSRQRRTLWSRSFR